MTNTLVEHNVIYLELSFSCDICDIPGQYNLLDLILECFNHLYT